MNKLSVLDWIVLVLVIIGALNWGLLGLFNVDLVRSIFGDMTLVSKIVYDLVGLAGLYMIYLVMMLGKK